MKNVDKTWHENWNWMNHKSRYGSRINGPRSRRRLEVAIHWQCIWWHKDCTTIVRWQSIVTMNMMRTLNHHRRHSPNVARPAEWISTSTKHPNFFSSLIERYPFCDSLFLSLSLSLSFTPLASSSLTPFAFLPSNLLIDGTVFPKYRVLFEERSQGKKSSRSSIVAGSDFRVAFAHLSFLIFQCKYIYLQ